MADQEPKIQFEINIADTLAKLHLGGASVGKGKGVWFFNSGITGYDPEKDDPENPHNTKFDMSNKSGKYEVGVMFTEPLTVEVTHSPDEIKQANGEEAGITEPADKEEHTTSEAGQKMIDANKEKIEEVEVKQYRKPALDFLKAYMAAFAGKDAASKIKDADMVRITIEDGKTPENIKYVNFKIPNTTDAAVAKMKDVTGIGGIIASEQKGDSKDIEIKNICYKIGYTLDVKA